MAEQSPAPTSSRSIYGFVVFLLFTTLFIIYVLWSFIPLDIFKDYLGITELPNKYFALFIPILILTATTLFAFCIYPSMSFIMTTNLDSVFTITDESAIRRCQHRDANGVLCDNKIRLPLNNDWAMQSKCDNHQNRESKISNYCDCRDKSKCMLAADKTFIDRLRQQENHKNSADLDIFEVSQILYGNERQ